MASTDDVSVSALEMAVIEQNAVALGISIDVLMENAGRAVAEEAAHHLPPAPAAIVVLAGTGNNGGDGTCAAFYLNQWGFRPTVFMVRPPSEIRSPAALRCWERIRRIAPARIGIPPDATLASAKMVIDAMLGSGQEGPLRSPYRDAVEAVGRVNVPVLSVDLPTGLGAEPAIRPQWTVALSEIKIGMTAEKCGEITVRDIGIPTAARNQTGPGEFLLYPTSRDPASGGRRGRVLIVGGGPYAGAPALAAIAALRSGAERASVIAPSPAASAVQTFSPDLVVQAVGERRFTPPDAPVILDKVAKSRVDAVVLGMGLGDDAESIEFARQLVAGLPEAYPLVVDAEAIQLLAQPTSSAGMPKGRRIIATPNQGEFVRYFRGHVPASLEDHQREVQDLARRLGVTMVVKGPVDVVSDGTRTCLNRHHPVSQNVAGAGDVLAGVLGGLLAQGLESYFAGRLATHWVGAAGYLTAEDRGPGLIASDLIDALPRALVNGLRRVRPVP
jgi:ADP-dependent NAD(P)H-hydrate dehydratase / NAD(P)H-hydrate epimerase